MFKSLEIFTTILIVVNIIFLFNRVLTQSSDGLFISALILVILILFAILFAKLHRSNKLNIQIKNSILFQELDKYVDSSNLNLSDKNFKQQLHNYNTRAFLGIIFCIIGVLLGFLFLPIILFPLGLWIIHDTQKQIPKLRSWIINNIDIPEIDNLQIISRQVWSKLHPVLILNKIFLDNTHYFDMEIIDFCTFNYKSKKVALVNFRWGRSGNEYKQRYYSCLITKNPDTTEGKTLAWSHRKSAIKFRGHDLVQNIRTKNLTFDKLFKVISTNQQQATLHLKTNIIESMINLAKNRQSILYFDEDLIFIITQTNKDLLDIRLSYQIQNQQAEMIKNIKYTILRNLRIFDEFWPDSR